MPSTAPPTHADPIARRRLLPTHPHPAPHPPATLTDTPEDLARRDHAAIARIAALHPANATEADLAALYVAASEQWKDCLRLALQPELSAPWVMKCRAQANAMMRQAQSALRLLLRMQATRQKTEADNEACDRAAWVEHCAIGMMVHALSPQAAPAEIAEAPAPGPAPQSESDPVQQPQPSPLAAAEPLAAAGPLAEAEQYAAIYPERAELIRRIGRVPEDVSFGPPDENLVQALITARTPAFITLDCQFTEPHST